MPIIEDQRTIKEARAELRRWGKFWQRHCNEGCYGNSWKVEARKSDKSDPKHYTRRRYTKEDDRYKRVQGVDYPVDASASKDGSRTYLHEKEVFVPWSLQAIDDLIESMQIECSSALREKYIYERDAAGVWLDRAERIVMYSL